MSELKTGLNQTAGNEPSAGNLSTVMIGGGTGTGRASHIRSFTAPSGEFVIWIYLGSTSLHSEKFWRAFCKTLKRWSSAFTVSLEQAELPTEIKDISRFAALLNQVSERTGKAILVVENVQLLADGPVKNLIDNISVGCAQGISTILLSEQDVDIMGVSRRVTSSRNAPALAFTSAEIRVYFTALGIVLDEQMLTDICELTEGWPQAICQLGKYLPGGEALKRQYIENAVHQIFQYFYDESHASMKPELRHTLILLSMLNSFALEMALELTAITPEECSRLYEDHFFRYSASRNQTCFHKLYQTFLTGMQNELPKKTKLAFLRKAALWYDQCGMLIEAVACYVGCKEYDAVLPVLQKRSVLGFAPDQAARIAKWLERIPQSYLDEHPLHRLYLIFIKFYAGEQEIALRMQRELYAELEGKRRNAAEDLVLGELHVSEAFQAWSDISIEYYRHMKAADELLPNGSAFLDVDEEFWPIASMLHFHDMQPGDLLRAKEICLKSAPHTDRVLPNSGNAACYLAVAEVHLYRCEFDDAIEYANLAASEGTRTETWGMVAESCYMLQRIHMALGELDDILDYGQQAIDYYNLEKRDLQYSIERITKFHENVYFALYHLLDSFAEANPLINRDEVNHVNLGRELYVHAIYKVYARRQYYPALTFIDKACQVSRSTGMFFSRLKLQILKAIVYAKMEKPVVAARSLVEAYRLSEANEILFSFMEFGAELLFLLEAVEPHLGDEIPKAWRERVRQEAAAYQQQRTYNTWEYLRRTPHIRTSKLSELTKQEYNALKYASIGKTTDEAAQMLRVNQSTIYRYLSRAYQKMGVDRREDAVQIAIMEGILG